MPTSISFYKAVIEADESGKLAVEDSHLFTEDHW
jgi:hypothetical protein